MTKGLAVLALLSCIGAAAFAEPARPIQKLLERTFNFGKGSSHGYSSYGQSHGGYSSYSAPSYGGYGYSYEPSYSSPGHSSSGYDSGAGYSEPSYGYGYSGGSGYGGGGGYHAGPVYYEDDKGNLLPLLLLGSLALLIPLGVIGAIGAGASTVVDTAAAGASIIPIIRKKRDAEEMDYQQAKFQTAIERLPEGLEQRFESGLVNRYLQCAGDVTQKMEGCLERLVCEYSSPKSKMTAEDKETAAMAIHLIESNKVLGAKMSTRIAYAQKIGTDHPQGCNLFKCKIQEYLY